MTLNRQRYGRSASGILEDYIATLCKKSITVHWYIGGESLEYNHIM